MTWLIDTLVWTGVLIALVLVLRRPLARHLGPRAAYALWALPILRLALPPLVLPAWFASASTIEPTAQKAASIYVTEMSEIAVSIPAETQAGFDWMTLVYAVWLCGAAAFIALRIAAYFRLRGALLVEARTVGHVGRVRLIETPSTRSPLAFGVLDKVVALPCGFMAMPDRSARDLALAHELAHHRSHDLTANFVALPLFALHWFNPLSWLGWQAMRRDQEAACDARVVDGSDRMLRARYAAVIAEAAALPPPHVALAAPMACPVLGDKSIIQRLRNLTMNDVSARRRRFGTAFVGIAALALPLTASISYAQSEEPEVPAPPAPPVAPLPPEAPDAPAAPPAPPAPLMEVDPSARVDGAHRVYVIRTDKMGEAGEDKPATVKRFVIRRPDGPALAPDSPEFKAHMKEMEAHFAEMEKEFEKANRLSDKQIKVIEMRARDAARMGEAAERLAIAVPRIDMKCDDAGGTKETKTEDGRRIVRVCHRFAMAPALGGLRSARAAIAGNTQMSEETRRKVIEELDAEIARMERDNEG